MNATAIALVAFDFSLHKNSTSTATAINFPLRLAWATTAHKIQGHTVTKPKPLILDFNCWLQRSMVYVMLSRVQCLSQLFILDSLPQNKNLFKPWDCAHTELNRLELNDISQQPNTSPSIIQIMSLNVRSLPAHIQHIQGHYALMSAQLILLQETWLPTTPQSTHPYTIQHKQQHFNNAGRGKGIATYFTPDFALLNMLHMKLSKLPPLPLMT